MALGMVSTGEHDTPWVPIMVLDQPPPRPPHPPKKD